MLVVVLTITLQLVFSRHFQYEEGQQNILNMQRVKAAFDNNFVLLNYLAQEWSNLPELKSFINEESDDFLQRHVQPDVLEKMNLDAFLVIDKNGDIFDGGIYDFEKESFVDFSGKDAADITSVFQAEENSIQSTTLQGVMVVEEKPLLLVSNPIYSNDNESSLAGQVILGHFFNETDMQSLARQVKFPIEVGLFAEGDLPGDMNIARNYFLNNSEEIYMLPVSEFHVAGFISINDLKQQPALILRAEQYRYVARNADVVLRYMLLAIIVSATVFAAIIFGGIEQTVLSRLSRLTNEVQEIAAQPGSGKKVTVDRKDEIASVGANINRMLDALEENQQMHFDELSILLGVSRLFLEQKSLSQVQNAICELGLSHFDAEVVWLGERSREDRMIPIAAAGRMIEDIEAVSLFEHTLHQYLLKPVFEISSLDLYGRLEGEIFYAIVFPLNWGKKSQALYIYVPEKPNLNEQDQQFLASFGSLSELVLRNTQLLAEVKANQENLQELSHRLVRVHEEERRNLARELHDEIGQYLTALKLRLSKNDEQTINTEDVRQAQKLLNELIQKVRQLSLDLRPSMLDDLGLKPALEWYLDRYTQQTGIAVDFDPQFLEQKRFSNEVEISIFRIVQESLNNVARHAGVKKVYVQLEAFQDSLQLMIEDEGIGFSPVDQKAGDSSGLTGMAERTKLLQGEMEIQSKPGQGTRILVRLPLNQEQTS